MLKVHDVLIANVAHDAQVAQLVEQRTENPRVGGSNPPLGTTFKTVSSNINMLACSAYWSTIKTLPATLPEPSCEIREPSFGKLDA